MKYLGGAVIALLFAIVFGGTAFASPAEEWRGELATRWSKPASFDTRISCTGVYEKVAIDGYSNKIEGCVTGGDTFRFVAYIASGHPMRYAVSFASDSKYYEINGLCGGIPWCRYNEASDTAILYRHVPGLRYQVILFENFSSRLERYFDSVNLVNKYKIDMANPDYQLIINGQPATSTGVGISPNGKWLAMDIQEYGSVRINLETKQVRRVEASGNYYGLGHRREPEMAITNDGSTIAIMGQQSGIYVMSVNENCGGILRPGAWVTEAFSQGESQCYRQFFDGYAYEPEFLVARNPFFDREEMTLRFTVFNRGATGVHVALSPVSYQPQPLRYIALGDSFTSGEGELNDDFYNEHTNSGTDKCHVSKRAYPNVFGALLGFSDERILNIACSGATSKDILGNSSYDGQNSRAEAVLKEQGIQAVSKRALENYIPGHIPQLAFIERYQPEIVTVGIGGNDAGFMEKLKACVSPGTCRWAKDSAALRQTGDEIVALKSIYQSVFNSIRERSPGISIMAISYPNIVTISEQCGGLTGILLDAHERKFISESISLINNTMMSAANESGVQFSYVQDTFRGYELCSGGSPLSVNGVRIGDDIAPISFLPKMKIIGAESFHPTPSGHHRVATKIFQSIPPDSGCENECLWSILNEYWRHDDVDYQISEKRRQHAARFMNTESYAPNTQAILKFKEKSFTPGSSNELLIDEKEVSIQAVVDEKGSFSTSFILPEFEHGYYTVRVIGRSFSDEPIEMYQTIFIGEEGEAIEDIDNGASAGTVTPDTPSTGIEKPGAVAKNRTATATQPIVTNLEILKTPLWDGVLGVGDTVASKNTQPNLVNPSDVEGVNKGVDSSSPRLDWLLLAVAGAIGIVVALAFWLLEQRNNSHYPGS